MGRHLRSLDWLLIPAALCVVWWLRPLDWPWWVWFAVAGALAGAGALLRPRLALDPLKELRRQILELRLAKLLGMGKGAQMPVSPQTKARIDEVNRRLLAGLKEYQPIWHLWNDTPAEEEVYLLDDARSPLAKFYLPVRLGIIKADDRWYSADNLLDTARDYYGYSNSKHIFTVRQFEGHRDVIEQMWGGPVIIELHPKLAGGVSIRPAPKVAPVVSLGVVTPGRVVLGTDLLTGNVSTVDVLDLTHTLIVGTAGFGKSVFLNQVLTQLLAADREIVSQVVMVDLKGGVEFGVYSDADAREKVVWKYSDVIEVVDELIGLMERRQGEMRERGWRLYPGKRVFFVVDEFAQVQLYPYEGKEGRATHDRLIANLNRLSMLGRAMGIVIIAAIQKATTDVMDSSFRMNLQGSVCFRVPNRMMASSMFGSVEDLRMDPVTLPRGRFIYYNPTTGTTQYLQAHVVAG